MPMNANDAGWVLCDGCRSIIYGKRLYPHAGVCPPCGPCAPLTALERLALLADPGTVAPFDVDVPSEDPLGFVDSRTYPERLAAARSATGLAEAVVCADVVIGGTPAVAAGMDFRFLGGSLGGAVGEMIARAAERALHRRTPMVIVTASGGVRMHEGAIGLLRSEEHTS